MVIGFQFSPNGFPMIGATVIAFIELINEKIKFCRRIRVCRRKGNVVMDDNEINKIKDWCKMEPFVNEICYFNKNMDDEAINQVYKSIKEYDSNVKTERGLWAIFGGNKDEKYKCLQVGSSYNINKELKDVLDLMRLVPKKILVDTTFTKKAFSYETGRDKNSEKYRTMYKKYDNFIFLCINADAFSKESKKYDCVNFAEVKFAFLTKALLWNPAPSTYSRGNKNKEKEIYNKIKNNEIEIGW